MLLLWVGTNDYIFDLARRLQHYQAVEEIVAATFQDFLDSPFGQKYQWGKVGRAEQITGLARLRIEAKQHYGGEEGKSTFDVFIFSHGQAVVEIGRYHLPHDECNSDLERVELDLEHSAIEDAASRITAVALSSGLSQLAVDFERHIQSKLQGVAPASEMHLDR